MSETTTTQPTESPAIPSPAPEVAPNGEPTTDDTEDTGLSFEDALSVLDASQSPFVAAMWAKAGPAVTRLRAIAETLRRVTITEAQITEAINAHTDNRVKAERDAIAKIQAELTARIAKIRDAVKSELMGPETSEAQQTELRTEFASQRDIVTTLAKGVRIMLSDEPDSPEFEAVEVLTEEAPTLRGTGKRLAKVTGGDLGPIVRKWAKDNSIPVGDRGRIPDDVMEQFRKAHPNGTSDIKG